MPAAIHRSDIRRGTESFRPPDDRTYSAEDTTVRSNHLLHRICAHLMLFARPYILIHPPTNVKHYLDVFHKNFHLNLVVSNRGIAHVFQGPCANFYIITHIYYNVYIRPKISFFRLQSAPNCLVPHGNAAVHVTLPHPDSVPQDPLYRSGADAPRDKRSRPPPSAALFPPAPPAGGLFAHFTDLSYNMPISCLCRPLTLVR